MNKFQSDGFKSIDIRCDSCEGAVQDVNSCYKEKLINSLRLFLMFREFVKTDLDELATNDFRRFKQKTLLFKIFSEP